MAVTGVVDRCVHELFEDQVARRPEATALIAGDDRLSYAELDERADRLAHRLAGAGVRRGALVGVHLGRGVDLVVATLAGLKAGAGYLMLDPDHPAERLRRLAADAGAEVVLTDADPGSGARLPRGAGGAGPDDVACVMFTSGSTGQAKGVAAAHRAIVGTLAGQRYLRFGPDEVWLQCAPVSWDAFALELWGALLFGGTCVLHPGQRPDPVLMARLVAEHGITTMYLSSSLFNVVVDEYPAALAGVRQLMVGGEALSPVHVGRALDRYPDLRLGNGYGPVEAMIFVTTYPVTRADAARAAVPIGRPLAAKAAHVLDERLRPVADGQIGELYAAGLGLAHGYLRRPGSTAERFIADPLGGPGARMYRTGDLVRRGAGGVLEFVGRADTQVKIRGFRVEPAEVEAVLARHPAVDRTAVVAADDGDGGTRLVAYLVPRGGPVPDPDDLRAHAAAVLPEFMVPSAFVALESLPLTPTGKLDRAALAPPPRPSAVRSIPSRPPRTETEKVLCELYAAVVGVASVGIDDSFFALGGDSLQVIRLLGRVRDRLGAELGIRAVFEAPTVAALAEHVDRIDVAGPLDAPPVAAPPARAPLSFAQRRLWFLDQIDAGVAYTVPVLIRLRGEVDVAALRAAVQALADRHEALRTVFVAHDGEPEQWVLPAQAVPFTTLRVAPEELDDRIAAAARYHFDLARDLPFRAVLFRTPDQSALLLVVHHIASDGWSLAPLMRDLSTVYAARRAGTEPDLPPLAVQYAGYAAAQRERLGDPADPDSPAARQLAFWRSTLDGLPNRRYLSRRSDLPAVPGPRAETLLRRIDGAGHTRLVALARRYRCSLFMLLHAALAVVLGRAGGATDIAIGAPVAGRDVTTVDDLVGFFVNMLVLRTDLSGDPTVAELLARVRDADLAALAHQEVPFEQVVEELNPPRSPGRHPLVDVVLALQNNARAELVLPGVETGVELLRTGAAMFEVLVDVTDSYGAGGIPEGLSIVVEYQAEAFDPSTMECLADGLVRVLDAMVAAPGGRIAAIDGLPVPAPAAEAGAAVPPARRGYVAPRTDLERRLAAVWSEVLGVDRIGVHDNFFVLGGNSLRAVRVAARLVSAEHLPATAAQLFAAPTVAELARAVATTPARAEPRIPRLPRVPRTAPARSAGQE